MSQTVLARKWRPKFFPEIIGQDHVSKALSNALNSGRLHHAYLFSGTRGVGKTTIARILSKCLNCERGVSATPCGQCLSCKEIANDRFVDLIEVDAASRTGVDDMRDLLNNVQYLPARGRFKVYLIDEVHMLSKSSFAALLKTLEEPPEHVKFLFATTDHKKVPITILSRCLHFSLRAISAQKIAHHLKNILENENVGFCEESILSISKAADGSVRDALSLTDQAIGIGGGSINKSGVDTMLGSVEKYFLNDICEHIASNDVTALLKSIDQMAQTSPDYYDALDQLISIFHNIAVIQALPEHKNVISIDDEVFLLAKKFTKEDVQILYQICLLGKRDLHINSDQRIGFEMIMLRCLSFKPGDLSNNLLSKGIENIKPETPNDKIETASPTNIEKIVEIVSSSGEENVAEQIDCKMKFEEFKKSSWSSTIKELDIKSSLSVIANNCVVEKIEAKTIFFTISEDCSSLLNEDHQEELASLLSKYFNTQIEVNILTGKPEGETPNKLKDREHRNKINEAIEVINNDPSIIKFKQIFDGSVDTKSVKIKE
jgi:DNA polymerase-3 subunit gamma/tau